MSTVVAPGSGPSASTAGDSSQQLSWEGDRMFNIYIYDYCFKRGFRNTARELLVEAEIPLESTPPINARQGLLFEWWSVFWVLFTAKSNGNGPDEAMLYTQHQAHQAAQRQVQQQVQQRLHPQAQVGRFLNGGMPRQPGVMPNGVGPPLLPGQGPGQGPVSFPMTGPGPQPNGIPGPVGAPSAPGASAQSSSFQPLLGQRPMPVGPQQRVPNGMPPFQSPTMAHSPTGGAPQHAQPPMGQLGPSPHLAHMNRGGMLPPNGPQGMNSQGAMGSAQTQTPTPSFHQIGRPPSRTATPGQNSMTQPSPSMASRQISGGMSSGGDMRQTEHIVTSELLRLSPSALQSFRQEAGLGEKDIQTCTLEEKQRILAISKRRSMKSGPSGANNNAAGPSSSTPSMQSSTQRNQQPPQRGNKRSSTSPGEEHEILPKLESSPPDRKRVRRSPMGVDQGPMSYPPAPQQGQVPGAPQQIPNGMMRGPMGGPSINGFPHQLGMPNMGANPGMNMPLGMGVPQMGNTMSPGMSHPGPGGMITQMTPQMQHPFQSREAAYRHGMHSLHKGNMPSGVMNSALPNAGSPSSTDPSFIPSGPPGQGPQFTGGVGPNNRMGPNKPMSMMPPPSPGMNGPAKDQQGSNKDGKSGNLNPSNGLADESSRNALNGGQQNQGGPNMGNAGPSGTAPATPVSGANQNMTAPSPSAILSNPGSMNQSSQSAASTDMPANLFSSDFIQSVASSLDEFDPSSIFRPDGDINFERDFGQWFNPDDVTSLEMK